jgi:hypothetical protein
MRNNTKAISFWHFLKKNTIEIPIIQRDYAQGRLGKEYLRKIFLADLKNALDSDKKMKLDFVYGSIENDNLNPLDGQQRLTTLWLLHWYIALRAGELNEENCEHFKKFTYETRISSREFCQNLCVPEYFKNFDGKDIVGFITKQTWFYSAWKQDPTIQSMLRMLGGTKIADKKGEDIIDGIEELFQETNEDGFKSYWEKLTKKEVIVFYHLPLKGFGLSDDLYIKMNARGKQLTDFENFKADLIGYITKQAEDNPESEWTDLLDAKNGFPIKLDTDWTDIFWKNKSKESNIDEIYFAFINRYFLQELICAKKEEQTDLYSADNLENENDAFKYLYGEKGDDSRLQYSGLDKYLFGYGKTIPCNFFTSLSNTLNNFKSDLYGCKFFDVRCINTYFPIWIDSKFEFIPKYDEAGNITTLGQRERVVFLAVCRYFEKGDFDETSFRQWMRVVWNIVENSGIETIPAMIGAMRLIDELSEGAHDIYNFLSNSQLQVKSQFAKDQVVEEIAKAKQILNGEQRSDGKAWEEIITEAEKYAFFKGAIGFLFTDVEGNNKDWDHFDKKWEKAKSYFDSKGVKDEYQVLLTRSLVVQCDNWEEQLYDKQIFNPNANTWKWILTAKNWKGPIHHILMGDEINPSNENNDAKVKQYVTSLFDKFPFQDMMEKVPDGRFKWYGGRLAFYYNKSDVITFDWDNFHRNEILVKLKDDKRFSVLNNQTSIFFWGWNIDFNYEYKGSSYYFQWWGRPNEKERDVYLMEDDWSFKERDKDNRTTDKGTDEDNYFCFQVKDDASIKDFIKSLNDLIEMANKGQQGSLTTNTLETVKL